MNDDIVAPVKGLINAFHKGTVLSQRIYKAARNGPALQMLDVVEPVQALERSLAQSGASMRDVYTQSAASLGRGFADAILNDQLVTNKLQGLTIVLLDQVMSLDDYIDDPSAFDLGSFIYIQRDSERCCDQATGTLSDLRQRMLRTSLQQLQLPPQDDRSQLSSWRAPSQPSPKQVGANRGSHQFGAGEEKHTARMSSPSQYESKGSLPASYGSHKSEDLALDAKPQPASRSDENTLLKLIDHDEVFRQMTANEELLKKRRKTRMSFHQDMEILRQSSVYSASTASIRSNSFQMSPVLAPASDVSSSPIQNSRPSSTLLMTKRQSHEQKAGQWPTTPGPGSSSEVLGRRDRIASQPLDVRPPEHQRQPATWTRIEMTVPIEIMPCSTSPEYEGKQVVDQLVSDPGLIAVNEEQNLVTPTPSITATDYPMRLTTSFYQYGGFCGGARKLLRGESGALKVIKKPGGMFTALVSVKCHKCAYEIGFNVYEKDKALDRAGIYSIGDVRFRQKFLSKCHLQAKSTDDPAYACIFCIEDGKTVDDYDATVFFSVNQFFRHLQKHPRPVKDIDGITVLYGDQPDVLDFDINFKVSEPKSNPFSDISTKLASLPTGHAVVDHRERTKGFKDKDPDMKPTLQFALGARISGITFPSRFNGTWCSGYHDGEKACFPAFAITLDPPKDNGVMNPRSTLLATARWDHKPKDTTSGWLRFSKRDKIVNISFPYQDAWCWTGQNPGGKWGLFPACFVEGLTEAVLASPGKQSPGDGSPKTHGGSSFSFSGLRPHPFHRRSTASG